MQHSKTHENIPVCITVKKAWWQFWKPKQIKVKINVTVNRNLEVAIISTWCGY